MSPRETRLIADGASLTLLSHSREMVAEFAYKDADYSFRFHATRWTEDGDNILDLPLDFWIVRLGPALQSYRHHRDISPGEAEQIAGRVADGLRAWPVGLVEARAPLKEIRFEMSAWGAWGDRPDPYVVRFTPSAGRGNE